MPSSDINFPIIPRWFTNSLRQPATLLNGQPDPTEPSNIDRPPMTNSEHDHGVLEFLFESVHSSRFINMKPTGVYTSNISHTICSDVPTSCIACVLCHILPLLSRPSTIFWHAVPSTVTPASESFSRQQYTGNVTHRNS